MGWGGRWERGSEWGIHVYPWLIHVNVWQKPLQYCKVISLPLKKKKNLVSALVGTAFSKTPTWARVSTQEDLLPELHGGGAVTDRQTTIVLG